MVETQSESNAELILCEKTGLLVPGTSSEDTTPLTPSLPASKQNPCVIDAGGKATAFSKLEPHQLTWYAQHDLRERYHVTFRLVLAKCIEWICWCAGAWVLYLSWYRFEYAFLPQDMFQHIQLFGIRILSMMTLITLLYWELYRHSLDVRAIGFRLVVTEGILWKTKRSIAIDPIMHITVKQSKLDLFFDIHRVDIWIPGSAGKGERVILPGFRRQDAYDLQHFLTVELNRRIDISQDALSAEDQMRYQELLAAEYSGGIT